MLELTQLSYSRAAVRNFGLDNGQVRLVVYRRARWSVENSSVRTFATFDVVGKEFAQLGMIHGRVRDVVRTSSLQDAYEAAFHMSDRISRSGERR